MGGRDTREKIAEGETRWRSSQEGTGLHLFFQLVCCAVYTLIHTNNHTQVKVKTLHVHIFAHGLRGASVSWMCFRRSKGNISLIRYGLNVQIGQTVSKVCWISITFLFLPQQLSPISQQFKCSILITHVRLPEFLIMPIKCWWNIDWRRGEMSAQGGRLSAPHLTRGERQA